MVLPYISLDLIEASNVLGPLALVAVSIAVYGIFVFHFYRFLARKDIISLDLQKHNQAKRPFLRKTISVIFYVFKFLLLYPVFVFVWFAVIAGLLYLMSRNESTDNIMLAAMGVVGAIRMCSYYNGALSTDIAKILPFALLGIMLIDSTFIDLSGSGEGVREAALQLETVVYYLIAVVALEFVLRILSGIVGWIKNKRRKAAESKEELADVDERDWRAEYAQEEEFASSADATVARVRPAREQIFMGEEPEEESGSPKTETKTEEVQEVIEWVRRRAAHSSPKPISPVPPSQPANGGRVSNNPATGSSE